MAGPFVLTNGPLLRTKGPSVVTNGPLVRATGPSPVTNGPLVRTIGPSVVMIGPLGRTKGPFVETNGRAPRTKGPFSKTKGPFPGKNRAFARKSLASCSGSGRSTGVGHALPRALAAPPGESSFGSVLGSFLGPMRSVFPCAFGGHLGHAPTVNESSFQ
jgi:hypothetical protein